MRRMSGLQFPTASSTPANTSWPLRPCNFSNLLNRTYDTSGLPATCAMVQPDITDRPSPPENIFLRKGLRHYEDFGMNGEQSYPPPSPDQKRTTSAAAVLFDVADTAVRTQYRGVWSRKQTESASCKVQAPPSKRLPAARDCNRETPYAPTDCGNQIACSNIEAGRCRRSELQGVQAMRTLIFVCGPVVLLSLVSVAWVLVATVIVALKCSICTCARCSYAQQIFRLLYVSLIVHLRCLDLWPSPQFVCACGHNISKLIIVNFASPLLSIGIIISAWIIACYWLMASIEGDPTGNNERYDSGEDYVLLLRSWWAGLLCQGLHPLDAESLHVI